MTASAAPIQEMSLDSYLILPETRDHPDLLVTADRLYQGKNWYQAHKALHQEGSFMPTPRQFFDLIRRITNSPKNVYDGTGKRIGVQRAREIEKDILEKREPWRAEYLDAYFVEFNGTLYMLSDHRTIDGRLVSLSAEPLKRCLTPNCYADLRSINNQGLPTRKSRKQSYSQGENIYFWSPEHNSVAGFRADSDGAGLDCFKNPRVSVAELGVHAIKIREK